MARADAEVRFVVGANSGTLGGKDLRALREITKKSKNSSLTVIRFSNALFHPKNYLIQRVDGSLTALVGSANFTPGGTEVNVEAGVIHETFAGDDSAVSDAVRAATERWISSSADGVFHIASGRDIDDLVSSDVIGVKQSKIDLRLGKSCSTGSRPARS